MLRRTPCVVALALGLALTGRPALAQSAATTLVIVVGQEASVPVPTVMTGTVANTDVAGQLFLRLADPGPELRIVGDEGFVPRLARSWQRRDSVTLAFDLDPRARWHDGVPVTSADVVFSFDRARNPKLAPNLALLLRHIMSVTAEGDHRVVFKFDHAYPDQFYDATFHVQPVPAHLLAPLPPDSIGASGYATAPVGDGPYRWARMVPGQLLELNAVPNFFLGHPAIHRLIFQLAVSPEARQNLLLSGAVDALANVVPPLSALQQLGADSRLRLLPYPSPAVGYLVFNYRDPSDLQKPNPILSDSRVRRALVLALDRSAMTQSAFGPYSSVPVGPVSPMLWISRLHLQPARQDTAAARRLLEAAGWTDHNGDGVLDREGRPLTLTLTFPSSSGVRRQMALQAQEQYRRIGVRLELQPLDPPDWIQHRSAGRFDLDFGSVSQDPSPSGLLQSWGCAGIGANNVGGYCDPAFDSLVTAASGRPAEAAALWRSALLRIEDDAPAAFLYAPVFVAAVARRFTHTTLVPYAPWQDVWQWQVAREPGR